MSRSASASEPSACKACSTSVRIPRREVERILHEFLREHPQELVDDATCACRLAACDRCADLQYGTTCRHCGCLVVVRARLAAKHCPSPAAAAW